MSFHQVQKAFNWSPNHLTDAMADPEIREDVKQDTGVDIVQEALDPKLALSMQGLQRAVKLGTY
jgi:hypothetical protein